MPYQWVEPDKFISSPPGLSDVYYHYSGMHRMDWHYQIEEDRFDSGWTAFDIRELARAMDAGREAGDTRLEHISLIKLAMSVKPLSEGLKEIGYEGETE